MARPTAVSVLLVHSPEMLGEKLSFFRMPLQIPFVVTGAVYLQFYYQLVATTGFNPVSSLLGLLLAHLFIVLPYTVSAIAAVVPRADSALEEAAETLGATK